MLYTWVCYVFYYDIFHYLLARLIDGDEESWIRKLHDYRLELLRTHPRSTIMLKCINQGVFDGMYISLAPLKAGFMAGCRSFISVDGYFLKGLYGGQLLTAVGVDANDGMYPIAWAVVSIENRENWTWFLELLAADLEINNSHHWAFMSDRQKVSKTISSSFSNLLLSYSFELISCFPFVLVLCFVFSSFPPQSLYATKKFNNIGLDTCN